MLFSLEWLLRLCPVDAGAERIAEALTSRGLTVDSLESGVGGEVLDIDIPANRPDCLGHFGVARELAAAFGAALVERPPLPWTAEAGEPPVKVEIAEPDLCSRYTASLVGGVRIGPSPDWVVRRLESCGLRSVNNAVDASNLVLLELGHPIHFFDRSRLEGGTASATTIQVRRAEPGDVLTTLDGEERRLDPEMLVIADGRRAVALAGVMGGANSEIGESTRDVLIEAAHFNPRSIRSTARKIGLQTDASFRFERGVDPEGLIEAQALAVRLLQELAGGQAVPGLVDAYPRPSKPRRLALRAGTIERLLGFRPEPRLVHESLAALQLGPSDGADDRILVTVPTWRADLQREADLVEEVARHTGYDRIPTADSGPAALAGEDTFFRNEERGRDILAHLGFHEAFGYAMIGAGDDDRFVPADVGPALILDNPIAETLAHLRRSILPGLLRAADLNLRRGVRDVRLFEVGRVFLAGRPDGPPREPSRIGLVWAGAARPSHWSEQDREVDLYDLVGVVERLLDGLHPGLASTREAGAPAAFHPARSLRWKSVDGEVLGWGGTLHPELQADLDQPLLVAEVHLDPLTRMQRQVPQHSPVPRLPAVTRDLSLIVTGELSYAELLSTIEKVDSPAPATFDAVDRYEGSPLRAGEASLTIRVTLQPRERTLTDAETEGYRQSLVRRLADDLGVRIRA